MEAEIRTRGKPALAKQLSNIVGLEEREVLGELRKGNRKVLSRVCAKLMGLKRAIDREMLRNPDDAEDALQRTYLKLVEKAETIASRVQTLAHFANYVFRMNRNVCRDIIRERRPLVHMSPDDGNGPPSPSAVQTATQPGAPHRHLIAQLLARLPAYPEREVVILHHLWGLSIKEIALARGMTYITTWRILRRSERLLRNMYMEGSTDEA